jgi:hypothetical protein
MPQLDKVTFLSGYFWLLITYCGFFLIIQKIYSPRFARILLYREKKISSIDTNSTGNSKNLLSIGLFDQISHKLFNKLTEIVNRFFFKNSGF